MTAKGLKDAEITIGSDPEFVLFNTNTHQIITGYEFFKYGHKLKCPDAPNSGCYGVVKGECKVSNSFCGHLKTSPSIGCDGSLGELRPKEARLPLEHVENIRDLLGELKPMLDPNITLRAGTVFRENNFQMSVGGHIHIGMSGLLMSQKSRLSKYLSYYCGIPLKKIEKLDDVRVRGWQIGGYGYFGGFYIKKYGIEWRMPASWLINIDMAKAALCLAYVVAQDFTTAKNITVRCNDQQYKDLITGDITPIITKIKHMEYYKYYKNEIDPVIEMIENKQTWNTDTNILENWQI